mgnify:CR=1 FL=1
MQKKAKGEGRKTEQGILGENGRVLQILGLKRQKGAERNQTKIHQKVTDFDKMDFDKMDFDKMEGNL